MLHSYRLIVAVFISAVFCLLPLQAAGSLELEEPGIKTNELPLAPCELAELAEHNLQKEFDAIPGIARVDVWGGRCVRAIKPFRVVSYLDREIEQRLAEEVLRRKYEEFKKIVPKGAHMQQGSMTVPKNKEEDSAS